MIRRIHYTICSGLIITLIRDGRIHGNLVGTVKENAIFYPKVYTDAQKKCIESFFAQNSYLGNHLSAAGTNEKIMPFFRIDYSLVRSIGISNPECQAKLILEERYESSRLLFLTSSCMDLSRLVPQLEMNIEHDLMSNDYADLCALVPSSFIENDIEKLLTAESSIITQIKSLGGEFISNTFVVSKKLLEKIDNQLNLFCEECLEQVDISKSRTFICLEKFL